MGCASTLNQLQHCRTLPVALGTLASSAPCGPRSLRDQTKVSDGIALGSDGYPVLQCMRFKSLRYRPSQLQLYDPVRISKPLECQLFGFPFVLEHIDLAGRRFGARTWTAVR